MRQYFLRGLVALVLFGPFFAAASKKQTNIFSAVFIDSYETSITFPANYAIGDYVEFLSVSPFSAGASGYFEISITYTRGNIAAAATHIAATSHYDPNLWRETGRVNNNSYMGSGVNFTIDCNTEYGNPRFRIRATNTLGVPDQPLTVDIKVRSINFNTTFTTLDATGNDLSVTKFLPMTANWDLYVGNSSDPAGASLAIKAIMNGNVGIGTSSPAEKLSVNGKIRAQEIKVEMANWPDYVFKKEYKKKSLKELENYIKLNGHLPDFPTADSVIKSGVELGNMVKHLLKNQEDLTLHLIEQEKAIQILKAQLAKKIKNITN